MERTFKEACIIALTETWLDEAVPDTKVELDNFTIFRAEWTEVSGKGRSGGVNNRWCNNIKIHNKVCTPNLEMLTLSLRSYHLPREFVLWEHNRCIHLLYSSSSWLRGPRHLPVSTVQTNTEGGHHLMITGLSGCTDWDVFEGNLEERVSTITDYINSCISTTIPVRTCKRYSNSKPWITHHINHSFKEKRKAFKRQDWASLRTIKQHNHSKTQL